MKTAAVAHPRMTNPEKGKERALAMRYDLEILEKLTSIAETLPRVSD
jgi:hypothetical protein